VAEPVNEAKKHVQQADVAYVDETSFPQQPIASCAANESFFDPVALTAYE